VTFKTFASSQITRLPQTIAGQYMLYLYQVDDPRSFGVGRCKMPLIRVNQNINGGH
jgi:dTDP-glucose pyrophosphorylase